MRIEIKCGINTSLIHLTNIFKIVYYFFFLNAEPNFPEFAEVHNGIERMEGLRSVQRYCTLAQWGKGVHIANEAEYITIIKINILYLFSFFLIKERKNFE